MPGPVSVKKTLNKPRGKPFQKGCESGPGRPRGVPNKFNGNLKEAILAGINGSYELGVAGFVLELAIDTPTSAAALLGRFVPMSMASTVDATLKVIHIDETSSSPAPIPSGAAQT